MEEIQRLYKEIKDLDEITAKYKNYKDEINILANEIEYLKLQRKKENIEELQYKISLLEEEYKSIFHEIDCLSMLENVCLSVDDLETVINNIKDSKKCFEKSMEFMEKLISSKIIEKGLIIKDSSLKTSENQLKATEISIQTEKFLELIKKETFSDKIHLELSKIIAKLFQFCIPNEVQFFLCKDSVLLGSFDQKMIDESFEPIHNASSLNFKSGFENFPNIFLLIGNVLKNNLIERIASNNLKKDDISANIQMFENTEAFVEDVDAWIVEISFKKILEICDLTYSPSFFTSIEDSVSGSHVSKSYLSIFQYLSLLNKHKHADFNINQGSLENTICSFFENFERQNLIENFVAFSDLTHLQRAFSFLNLEPLEDLREQAFEEIISISASVNINFNKSGTEIKNYLQKIYYDFKENLKIFVNKRNHLHFNMQFIERVCQNILDSISSKEHLYEADKNTVFEICNYLLNLSSDNYSSVSGRKKIIALLDLMNSSIENLIQNYDPDTVEFENEELKSFVRLFVEPSQLRDEFIESL